MAKKQDITEWIQSAKDHLNLAAEKITEYDDGALIHLDDAIIALHRVYLLIGLEKGVNYAVSHQIPEAEGDN